MPCSTKLPAPVHIVGLAGLNWDLCSSSGAERMATAKVRDRWQQLFWGGIKLKGLNGLFELIGGVLLLLVDPESLHHWTVLLTQNELNEDPDNGIATFLGHSSESLTSHAMLFSARYLLTHGLAKVVLLVAVLKTNCGHTRG
ncbi:hypothetical protein SB89_03840 [Corynebacterium glutamicum]|nr:hypothetical protein SB89_03840 [Corynebacterium glutamicum]OKX86789.1 hypothetical protein AUP72_13400 [Corynebacterium glutamicum]TWS34978.1 hypothetical protein AKJ21_10350 [Corynebacterium glutamicum]